MKIVQATLDDLEQIWNLRLETTELLKQRGIDQWQYKDPAQEIFIKDILNHEFYVVKGLKTIRVFLEQFLNSNLNLI